MFETMFGTGTGSMLGMVGTLAAINTIIVEVLKAILPKKVPTKLVSMITSVFVVLGYIFVFEPITIQNIAFGVVGSFVIAFISMFGFDALKDVFIRFKPKDEKEGEKNG